MRRTGAILVAAIILLSVTACSGKEVQSNAKSVSLYQKGQELTLKMDMLAEDEEYVRLYTAGLDIGKIIADIGSQDYSKPKAVYEITGVEDAAFRYLISENEIKLDENIQEFVKKRFSEAVANQISAMNGSEFIASTSILTVDDSFIYKGLEERKLYLFLYEGKYASLVTFVPHEDDIVEASASIMTQEYLEKIQAAADVEAFFRDTLGYSGLTVTEIKE